MSPNSATTMNSSKADDVVQASHTRFPILKDAEDYFIWSRRVETLIKMRDLKAWSCISGKDVKPAEDRFKDEDGTFHEVNYLQALEAWEKHDILAMHLISQCLSDEAYMLITNTNSAMDAWVSLRQRFGSIQFTTILRLEIEFDQLCQGVMSTEVFLTEVIARSTKLATLGSPVDPSKKLRVLIWGLGRQFDTWKLILQAFIDDRMPKAIIEGMSMGVSTNIVRENVVSEVISRIRSADQQLNSAEAKSGNLKSESTALVLNRSPAP